MARRLTWTESALADLEAVASYIALDSRSYAKSFVARIRAASRSLIELPHRGRMVPELDDPAIREAIIGRYRLIYRTELDTLTVLALIHGARDLPSLWRAVDPPGGPA